MREIIQLNYRLWTEDVVVAWESISITEKIVWLMFLANTISILTMLEFIFLG